MARPAHVVHYQSFRSFLLPDYCLHGPQGNSPRPANRKEPSPSIGQMTLRCISNWRVSTAIHILIGLWSLLSLVNITCRLQTSVGSEPKLSVFPACIRDTFTKTTLTLTQCSLKDHFRKYQQNKMNLTHNNFVYINSTKNRIHFPGMAWRSVTSHSMSTGSCHYLWSRMGGYYWPRIQCHFEHVIIYGTGCACWCWRQFPPS